MYKPKQYYRAISLQLKINFKKVYQKLFTFINHPFSGQALTIINTHTTCLYFSMAFVFTTWKWYQRIS